jgi:hypothetical protein
VWDAVVAQVSDLYQLVVEFTSPHATDEATAERQRTSRAVNMGPSPYYYDSAPVFLLGNDAVAHLSRVGGTDGVLTLYPASLHQTFLNRLQSPLYGSAARPYPNARFVRLFWNDVALAALRADGDIVTWGWDDGSRWSTDTLQSMARIRNSGADVVPSPDKPVGANGGVYHILPSRQSFAGLCLDGTVVYWGGVDSASIAFQSRGCST